MADLPFKIDHPNVIELTPDTGAELPGHEPIFVERESIDGLPGRDRLGYLIGADGDGNWTGPPEHTGADAVTVTVRNRYVPGEGMVPTSYEVLYWKRNGPLQVPSGRLDRELTDGG